MPVDTSSSSGWPAASFASTTKRTLGSSFRQASICPCPIRRTPRGRRWTASREESSRQPAGSRDSWSARPGDLPLIVVGGCLRQQVPTCSHCFAAVTLAYFGCERLDHLWYVRGQVSDALPPERQPQSGVETLEDLHELRCAGYQDQGLDPRGPARHPLGEARVLDTRGPPERTEWAPGQNSPSTSPPSAATPVRRIAAATRSTPSA